MKPCLNCSYSHQPFRCGAWGTDACGYLDASSAIVCYRVVLIWVDHLRACGGSILVVESPDICGHAQVATLHALLLRSWGSCCERSHSLRYLCISWGWPHPSGHGFGRNGHKANIHKAMVFTFTEHTGSMVERNTSPEKSCYNTIALWSPICLWRLYYYVFSVARLVAGTLQ